MLEARTLSVSIDWEWTDLYELIWRPEFFPKWATGLSKSCLTRDGDRWRAEGPEGGIWIRFTAQNGFGVMDHYVDLGSGPEIYVPLRVVENHGGAEVLLTLFRQAGMSDEQLRADAEWVERDLLVLRKITAPGRAAL